MNEHSLYMISQSIPEFAKSRKLNVISKNETERNKFISDLERAGYSVFVLSDGKRSTIVTILSKESEYHSGKQKILDIIKISEKFNPNKTILEEIIIIVPDELETKKNILKPIYNYDFVGTINHYNKSNKKTINGDVPLGIHYNLYPYRIFKINILRFNNMGKYQVLSQDEKEKLFEDQIISEKNLPTIFSSDPPIVWIGAFPGDVIKWVNNSLTTGRSVKYQIVVKHNIL